MNTGTFVAIILFAIFSILVFAMLIRGSKALKNPPLIWLCRFGILAVLLGVFTTIVRYTSAG